MGLSTRTHLPLLLFIEKHVVTKILKGLFIFNADYNLFIAGCFSTPTGSVLADEHEMSFSLTMKCSDVPC